MNVAEPCCRLAAPPVEGRNEARWHSRSPRPRPAASRFVHGQTSRRKGLVDGLVLTLARRGRRPPSSHDTVDDPDLVAGPAPRRARLRQSDAGSQPHAVIGGCMAGSIVASAPTRSGGAPGRLRGRRRRSSTPAAAPSCRASSIPIRTSCSPATGAAELRRRLGGATYAEIAADRRRHRQQRGRDARGVRGVGGRGALRPPRRDARAAARRPARPRAATALDHRERAEDAAAIRTLAARARRSNCRPRSWAPTRCRSSIATSRARLHRPRRRRDDSRGRAGAAGRMVRRLLRDRRVHAGGAREILEAGWPPGLKPRIHADELAASGGAAVGGDGRRAISADHLIFVDEAGAAGLCAAAGVVATLLPIAAFYPEARTLRAGAHAHRARRRRWRSPPT